VVAGTILESVTKGREEVAVALVKRLEEILHDFFDARQRSPGTQLVKLDKVLEMSKTGALSNTIAFTGGVDLESINKSKYAELVTVVILLLLLLAELLEWMSKNWRNKRQSSKYDFLGFQIYSKL
jgi:hypothetical protein